ncbi:hypothetical protein [Streptomyces halobius]|uniref:Integral membrane protein n=1 Tax=Streptomyces halobius TaxID=2879846 RepID=A0ABY4M582_9ACTN|nr:hypothetical protein [Streptomyces halobius]UQA91979.1 hypothetical protein K9S39_09065 [Streptomyces halobius]
MNTSDTLLEARFRAVLRVLPAYYRQEREEEMVDTFLSDHEPLDEDTALGRPGPREVAGVLVLAVRTRLAGPGAPARYVAYGHTARLVGLFGVALLAASTAVSLLAEVAVLLAGSAQERQLVLGAFVGRSQGSTPDAFTTGWALMVELLPLGWIAAAVALGTGHRRRAAVFCAAAAVPTFVDLGQSARLGFLPSASSLAAIALVVAVTASVTMAFHPAAPRVEVSRLTSEWIPVGCFLILLAAVVAGRLVLGFDDGSYGWAFLVGGVVCLVLRVRNRDRHPDAPPLHGADPRALASGPALPAALATLGLPVLTMRLDAAALFTSTPGVPAEALVTNVAQSVAVAILEATLLVVAVRALRRESRTWPSSTAVSDYSCAPGSHP